jgi:hypothetical protein
MFHTKRPIRKLRLHMQLLQLITQGCYGSKVIQRQHDFVQSQTAQAAAAAAAAAVGAGGAGKVIQQGPQ